MSTLEGTTMHPRCRHIGACYGNMSAHKKFQLKTKNLWLAVDPYMPPRRSGMHKYESRAFAKKNYSPIMEVPIFFNS